MFVGGKFMGTMKLFQCATNEVVSFVLISHMCKLCR